MLSPNDSTHEERGGPPVPAPTIQTSHLSRIRLASIATSAAAPFRSRAGAYLQERRPERVREAGQRSRQSGVKHTRDEGFSSHRLRRWVCESACSRGDGVLAPALVGRHRADHPSPVDLIETRMPAGLRKRKTTREKAIADTLFGRGHRQRRSKTAPPVGPAREHAQRRRAPST
jgi:hypothetical protein